MLTVFGLGGAALFGGLELAAGVVIGAGLDALIRRPRSQEPTSEPTSEAKPEATTPEATPRAATTVTPMREATAEPTTSEEPKHEWHLREKSRRMMSRAPHVIRERARAVVDAARGRQPGAAVHDEPGAEAATSDQPPPPKPDRPRIEQPATD